MKSPPHNSQPYPPIIIIIKTNIIIKYLRPRLEEDTTPDAIDSSLEADILNKIPKDISEMYVEATL